MRHRGAVKRERAIAYAFSQQVNTISIVFFQLLPDCVAKFFPFFFQQSKATLGGRSKQSSVSSKHSGFDQSNGSWNWSWLERWMAAKPWESRLMEHKVQNNPSDAESKEDIFGIYSTCSEPTSVRIKKNSITTRVSARPPTIITHNHCCRTRSASSPSTELYFNESSASSSSIFMSTPFSSSTLLASERTEDSGRSRPNYMSLTESIKAKQKALNAQNSTPQGHSSVAVRSHRKTLSGIDTDSSIFSCDLENQPPQREKSSVRRMEKVNGYHGKLHTYGS